MVNIKPSGWLNSALGSVLVLPYRCGFLHLALGLGISLIAASPAYADSKRVDFLLNTQGSETYDALLRQAESIARESIDRSFGDPTTTEVLVKILGEREGQISPLLYVSVSRADWQKNSSIQAWARYFNGSPSLLGFARPRSPDTQVATLSTPIQSPNSEPNFYNSN